VVERKNRMLIDMARTMFGEYKTLERFWSKAVNIACCWSLFSKAIHQEQSNTIVNYIRPSSFETLSPLGYNDLQMKVMKDVPSPSQ
jgi:hypothetical protein